MSGKSIKEIEAIAVVCHQANRAWCAMHGDYRQNTWGEAPKWQRDSTVDGVVHVLTFRDAQPEDSHNNWMAEKIADGWVYGPVKDRNAKTHPCIVPFHQLPEWQQKKDVLFLAIVRALA